MSDDSKPKIIITKKELAPGSNFMASFNMLFSQSWGGKADAVLYKIAEVVTREEKAYNDYRDKVIKQHGRLDSAMAAFTINGCPVEDIEEFNADMEAWDNAEVELPVSERVKLKKRRQNTMPPLAAAILSFLVEIEWPTDEGEHLDRDPKAR